MVLQRITNLVACVFGRGGVNGNNNERNGKKRPLGVDDDNNGETADDDQGLGNGDVESQPSTSRLLKKRQKLDEDAEGDKNEKGGELQSETSDSNSLDALKKELVALQASLLTKIKDVDQKYKCIEESGKKFRDETKDLKDLLYYKNLEIKTQKNKDEELTEKSRELIDLMEKSVKTIAHIQDKTFVLGVEVNGGNSPCLIHISPSTDDDPGTALSKKVDLRTDSTKLQCPKNCHTLTTEGGMMRIQFTCPIVLKPQKTPDKTQTQLQPKHICNAVGTSAAVSTSSNSDTTAANISPNSGTLGNLTKETHVYTKCTISPPVRDKESVHNSEHIGSAAADSKISSQFSINSEKPVAASTEPSIASTAGSIDTTTTKPKTDNSKNEINPEVVAQGGAKVLSFDNIPGLDDQIIFLRKNVIFPMANQEALRACGAEAIKAILFVGPKRSGQEELARALTTELSKILGRGFTFIRRLETHMFSKYSGEGEKYVKKLFEITNSKKPAVLFLNDLQTLCCSCNVTGSNDVSVVSELSNQVDKIKRGEVIVIACVESINKTPIALIRSGCFEKRLDFTKPGDGRRKGILEVQTAKWHQIPSSTTIDEIVKKTSNFSDDDLVQLCRQTYMNAIQRKIDISGNQTNYKLESLGCIQITEEDWNTAFENIEKNLQGAKKYCIPDNISDNSSKKGGEESITPEIIDKNLGFASVGGLEEQIKNVRENILFPMLNKEALADWGVEPVKGIIFYGPPGTGKTLLAKALAAELSRLGEEPFSFFYQKGTDSLQKYIGWTESYLKTLFTKAVAKKPAIIFFDEIDGLCSTRKEEGSSSTFYNGIVTTILGLLDGVKRGELFVIAATNRLDSLDPALRRPGRFDKSIAFFPPKEEGRKAILEIHSKKWKRGRDEAIFSEIAKQTEGYTGADLEQLCRQTFLSALRRQFPDLGRLGANDYKMCDNEFDNFDVLLEDWYTAMRSVKGSNNAVFGNSVSTGKATPPGVSRLLSGIQKEILQKLEVFLKAPPRLAGEEKGGGIKSFLIWDIGVRQTRLIENFIIQSLIGCPDFKEAIVFSLGHSDAKFGTGTMKSLMGQVLTCSKTAILHIPQMDKLEAKLAAQNTHHLFMEQMDSLRGENVLLLASAGCPISELTEDFRHIFKGTAESRSYKLRKFENTEVREFFSSIFQEHYPLLLDRVEQLTRGANFYDILDLKAELCRCCVSGKEKELNQSKLALTLDTILDNYEINKLDHSGVRNSMYT